MKAPSSHKEGLFLLEETRAGANVACASATPPGPAERKNAAEIRGAALDLTPPAWRGGFKEAYRHSLRVRLLRSAAAAGSVLAMALILFAVFFDPLRHLPADFSVKRVGLEGTKITVDFPKITGVQNNGRPFEIKARSGIQDITVPNIIELMDVESSLGTAESATSWVSAAHGVYDSSGEKLTLEGAVRIKSSNGYDIWLRSAHIDFKSGGLVSNEPVKVVLEGGAIEAKEFDVSDNGHKISFGGSVTSTIDNGEEEEPSVWRETAEGGQ
jgi:lipopolysaccharide export system protein LptC